MILTKTSGIGVARYIGSNTGPDEQHRRKKIRFEKSVHAKLCEKAILSSSIIAGSTWHDLSSPTCYSLSMSTWSTSDDKRTRDILDTKLNIRNARTSGFDSSSTSD